MSLWRDVFWESRRKWSLGLLTCLLVLGLGWVSYRGYVHWRQQRELAVVRLSLERQDYRQAGISLRRALAWGPATAELCRQAAAYYEHTGSREAIAWRQKAASLAVGSVRDQCLLVKAQVRFGALPQAEQTLHAIPASSRQSADYQEAAGLLASAAGWTNEAETHLSALTKLDPGNLAYRLEWATAAIFSPEPQKAQLARQELEQLREHPELQLPALRVLIQDAQQHETEPAAPPGPAAPPETTPLGLQPGERSRLLDFVKELASHPQLPVADHLLVLSVLRERRHASFSGYLAHLQQETAAYPEQVEAVMAWMNQHELAAEVLIWAKALPRPVRSAERVSLAIAETLIARHEWEALQAHLALAEWPTHEHVRDLIQAHLWREGDRLPAARQKLARIMAQASPEPGRREELVRWCQHWGWPAETEELLWIMAESDSERSLALEELQRFYRERGDSAGLRRVAEALAQLGAQQPAARNGPGAS